MSPAVVSIQVKNSYELNTTQVTVGVEEEKSLNTIFHFQCPGNSSYPHKLLLTADGRVSRPMKEVCAEKRVVRLAYHQIPTIFEVDNETNTMIEYPISKKSEYNFPVDYAYEWEKMSSFFQSYNLAPVFYELYNDDDDWGGFDADTGLWTGAPEMVNNLSLI